MTNCAHSQKPGSRPGLQQIDPAAAADNTVAQLNSTGFAAVKAIPAGIREVSRRTQLVAFDQVRLSYLMHEVAEEDHFTWGIAGADRVAGDSPD
jgi:hypothetical protein